MPELLAAVIYVIFLIAAIKLFNLNAVRSVGIVTASAIYIGVAYYFDRVFGETPVNLLGMGGSNGFSNFAVNFVSYFILTLILSHLPIYIIRRKLEYFMGIIHGTVQVTIYVVMFSFVYLAIAWN